MSQGDHSADARLDRALAGLAHDLPPDRDLWPAIAARLEPRRRERARWPLAAAAAVLLVAASSLITAQIMRRSEPPVAAVAPPTAGDTQRSAQCMGARGITWGSAVSAGAETVNFCRTAVEGRPM